MPTRSTLVPPSESDPAAPPHEARPRPPLSLTQVVAGVLAAVTATLAASFLGVAGTVIGAAVASVLTVVGNAVYGHSLARTSERVRAAVPTTGRLAHRATAPVPTPAAPVASPSVRRRWGWVAAASAAVFGALIGAITVVELVAGRPLSDVVQGRSGTGTTLLGPTGGTSAPTGPAPAATVTVTPSVRTVTPTVTVPAAPVTTTAPATSGEATSPAASSTPPSSTSPPPSPTSPPTSSTPSRTASAG